MASDERDEGASDKQQLLPTKVAATTLDAWQDIASMPLFPTCDCEAFIPPCSAVQQMFQKGDSRKIVAGSRIGKDACRNAGLCP